MLDPDLGIVFRPHCVNLLTTPNIKMPTKDFSVSAGLSLDFLAILLLKLDTVRFHDFYNF